MSIVSPLVDASNPRSFSNRMRSRRHRLFEQWTEGIRKPIRILDIGGTREFWERRGWSERQDVHITLLNLFAQDSNSPNFRTTVGDATDLSRFDSGSFDVVFSNSVIEHLFSWNRQLAMAAEVERVGRRYWVQTPNYWFPMEPHFHIPGWQWLPLTIRKAWIRRRRCGGRGPYPDAEAAERCVREVRLLTQRELRMAFPRGTLIAEGFFGLTKSFVVAGGFPEADGVRSF